MSGRGPGPASHLTPPRRVRAPRHDRGVLVDPPLDAVGRLIEENQARRARAKLDVLGRPLDVLRTEARGQLIEAARSYTTAYRDVNLSTAPDARLLLAGHQPELFHPGVWFKHFVLSGLAARHAAVAVNLVIDVDAVKRTSLRVPGGSIAEPTLAEMAYDTPGPAVTYEERSIEDRARFAQFDAAVVRQLAPLVRDPLVREFWPLVVARSRQTARLGECLAQARHQLEAQWGLETLEVPQSAVCDLPAFDWFAAYLLAHHVRLHAVYNTAVGEYRRANRIRSASHPVPDLAREGEWLEAPFWIWTADDPRRRRLFARQVGRDVELSDRGPWSMRLALSPDAADAASAVAQLAAARQQGLKLRTRALTTTIVARVLLSDLFLHGIGGAKYDEVSDTILRRFFEIEPPAYLTLSATLHLPVGPRRAAASTSANAVAAADGTTPGAATVHHIRGVLRDLTYHPERYIVLEEIPPNERGDAQRWLAEKARWLAAPADAGRARERHEGIVAANRALQAWLAPQRAHWLAQQRVAGQRERAASILGWREYAFCLYPAKSLQDFLLEFSRATT